MDHSRASTAYRWSKVLAGLLLVVALSWGAYLSFGEYLSADTVQDQGDRGLIVVATSGGSRKYNLNVRSFYEKDDQVRLVLYFTQEGTNYDGERPADRPEELRYEVAFVGHDYSESITCGTSPDDLNREPFGELAGGIQRAIRMDAVSASASATNFGNGGDVADDAPEPDLVKVWRGQLWTNPDGSYFSARDEDWAEECRLPASSVWRRPATTVGLGSTRALVPPQVNFTSMADETDLQSVLWSDATVSRQPGEVLKEGYPPPATRDTKWTYGFRSSWSGARGEAGNVGYTDQPVWIFGQRTAAQQQALALTLIGTVLGLVAALSVQVLSRTTDLLSDAWRDRRERS